MKKTEFEMKVMWDICSGLGGASEAFLVAGWTVIRIETEDMLQWVPKTRQLDVLKWKEWVNDLILEHGVPDFIWASPPCREFSTAYNSPRSNWERENPEGEWAPDMSILFAVQDILARVRPKHHVIENVVGASKYFAEHLGPHFQKVGPFMLWGRCPFLAMPDRWTHAKNTGDVHSANPMRSNLRAFVPIEISQAVLEAITHQTTLQEWC